MVFSIIEILNIILATLIVGYIFTGIVKIKKDNILSLKRFDWDEFRFSLLVSAPGVILHELAHKFIAIGFGLHSFFQVWPLGLAIGVILKLLGSGFILLAPGYVTTIGATPLESSLVALSGPILNLLLFLIAKLFVDYKKNMGRKQALFWLYTKEVNKWLFIFNILPIPPLDGYKAYGYLLF
ncbi:hypothetical protein J4440_01345 [Candidatus Woesearchaeota archaeon]|nr:hypothetical protein [Candidatus Woesearchaeota archaeon]